MRHANVLLGHASAIAFALLGVIILAGFYRVKPSLRLVICCGCLAAAAYIWRAAPQPWHWRLY